MSVFQGFTKLAANLLGGTLNVSGHSMAAVGVLYFSGMVLNGATMFISSLPIMISDKKENEYNENKNSWEGVGELILLKGKKIFILSGTITFGIFLRYIGSKITSDSTIKFIEGIVSDNLSKLSEAKS